MDDGTVVGVEDADAIMLRLNNTVQDSIKPDVTMFVRYETLELDGKKVVAATVQKGTDRPYYLAAKGLKPSGVYVRNGTSTDPSIEAYGTGMPKIMRAYQDCERQPKIEVTSNAFKITLPNCNTAVETGITPNGQEQKVIEYLKTHERITRKEVDTLLGISQSTSSRLLKRMLAEGTICQEGGGRRIRYP